MVAMPGAVWRLPFGCRALFGLFAQLVDLVVRLLIRLCDCRSDCAIADRPIVAIVDLIVVDC